MYKKSIYRYLGYEIKYKSLVSNIPIDYTKLSIIYFILVIIFTTLVLLSINMYNKFNNQLSIGVIEKDQIYKDVLSIDIIWFGLANWLPYFWIFWGFLGPWRVLTAPGDS